MVLRKPTWNKRARAVRDGAGVAGLLFAVYQFVFIPLLADRGFDTTVDPLVLSFAVTPQPPAGVIALYPTADLGAQLEDTLLPAFIARVAG